uniref:Receptor ligand binding region domain-containing protein n=1 Tax=Romanomermis culicivorax TaxID=13658 RepID=A0A915JTE9_ROMCU
MIYSQYALFMLRVFGLVQNAAFKYYAYSFNDSSLANSFEYLMGKLPVDPIGHMRTAKLPGHIVIGALFPIHRKTHGSDSCGEIWEQYGIHRSEVALQTVNEINQRSLIAPGVKLGIHIRDDCWTERIAMEQSIEFIRDVIGRKEGDGSKKNETSVDLRRETSKLSLFSAFVRNFALSHE